MWGNRHLNRWTLSLHSSGTCLISPQMTRKRGWERLRADEDRWTLSARLFFSPLKYEDERQLSWKHGLQRWRGVYAFNILLAAAFADWDNQLIQGWFSGGGGGQRERKRERRPCERLKCDLDYCLPLCLPGPCKQLVRASETVGFAPDRTCFTSADPKSEESCDPRFSLTPYPCVCEQYSCRSKAQPFFWHGQLWVLTVNTCARAVSFYLFIYLLSNARLQCPRTTILLRTKESYVFWNEIRGTT